jgi:hypothetical protein
MKTKAKPPSTSKRKRASKTPDSPAYTGKIHPVVIYPIKQPDRLEDLEALYDLVECLEVEPAWYARPITVMDRKTYFAGQGSREFIRFRKDVVARHSDIIDAWCVDTCQMWYTGLGKAFEQGRPGDVYWLIPGDFNYGAPVGQEVLGRLHDLPEIIQELEQDLCVGEIATDHNNSKQLIDTYGTFALLYNWFPAEAQEIRSFTERPRSEFFAIRHQFLGELLSQRWYPYEQTVVMLLQAVSSGRSISRFFVGQISDLPEGGESFSSALQQVERTERVLKSLWRQRHEGLRGWNEQYRALEAQSEQIRRTAQVILKNLLG